MSGASDLPVDRPVVTVLCGWWWGDAVQRSAVDTLATTGVPGLLLLLAMLVSAFQGRGRLLVPFIVSMFADGTFLGAAYWVFFALYTTEGQD